MKLFYIKKKPLFLKKKCLKLYKHKFYVMYKIYESHNDLIFQKKQSQSTLKLQNASHHEAFTTQKFIG